MGLWDDTLPFGVNKDEATLERLNEGKRAALDLQDNYFLRHSFRNLTMGVARDGNSATKVTLFNADEIVMHDGYRVPDWRNISADITSALDTGVEAVSTWYDIFAISRSSDDGKALRFRKARSFFADEIQTAGVATLGLGNLADRVQLAQGFQIDTTAPIFAIDLQLLTAGTPSGYVYLEIQSDNAGNPSGTVLATSDYLLANAFTITTYYRFHFRSDVTLMALTQYHMVLRATAVLPDAANYMIVSAADANPYARGELKGYNGTVWAAFTGWDVNFTLRTRLEPAALVLPSGYDRYAHIGYVYNSSVGDFTPFMQKDNMVMISTVNLGTFSNTQPVLINVATRIPPQPVMVALSVANTAAGNYVGASPPHLPTMDIGRGLRYAYPAISNNAVAAVELNDMLCEGQFLYCVTGGGTASLWVRGYRF